MPTLAYSDFENVKTRFPQTKKDSTINYAFACGGAVKLLLEADKVEEAVVRDTSVIDGRVHKDLELYAFNNCFGRLNPNPHDICGINFGGPLFKLDYEDHFVPCCGIYVEILNGHYFDSLALPRPKIDTRKAIKEGKQYFALSPEFLIVSKIMSANGIRCGVDIEDAQGLLRKFEIDKQYLADIAQRTEFAPVLTDADISGLEQKVEDRSFFSAVAGRIRDIYGEVIPFIEELPYSEASSLLKFKPESLVLTPKQKEALERVKTRSFEEFCRDGTRDDGYKQIVENPAVYDLCMIYTTRFLNQERDTNYQRFANGLALQLKADGNHCTIARAAGINQALAILRKIPLRIEGTYDRLSYTLAEDILSTPYAYVMIARYKKQLNEALRKGINLDVI